MNNINININSSFNINNIINSINIDRNYNNINNKNINYNSFSGKFNISRIDYINFNRY